MNVAEMRHVEELKKKLLKDLIEFDIGTFYKNLVYTVHFFVKNRSVMHEDQHACVVGRGSDRVRHWSVFKPHREPTVDVTTSSRVLHGLRQINYFSPIG